MKRCEQKSENTWDLSSLCKDIEDFKARYNVLINKVSHLSSYNTRLGESSDVLYCALEEIKDVLKYNVLEDGSIDVTWTAMISGSYILHYGMLEKTIVVESLF